MNNKIQEAYCSFENSKLLLENGFKNYKNFGYITSYYHAKTKNIIRHGLTGKTKDQDLIYRVPQHIALEWLRINLGIWVDIGYEPINNGDEEPQPVHWWSMVSKIGIFSFNYPEFHGYSSPQEATEEAITFILKNLINKL